MTHRTDRVAALALIAAAALGALALPGCFLRSYDLTPGGSSAPGQEIDADIEADVPLTTDVGGVEIAANPPGPQRQTTSRPLTLASPVAPMAGKTIRVPAAGKPAPVAAPTPAATDDPTLDHIWLSPSYDERKYSEIYVAPVDTRQIAQLKTIQRVNPIAFDQSHGALRAAGYAQRSLKAAVEQSSTRKYKLIDHPGARTLVVAMAITALAPNRIGVGAADYVGPVLGDPAALTATNLPGRGWIEMQTELRDGASGEVMAVISDARAPPVPVASPALLGPYTFSDAIIERWARAIV
ncbi:MAG: DUF3313 family protein, partial [Candidatus Binataceae bacterium]